MINYLIELDAKVPLKELVDKGLIGWKVVRDRDVYLSYDASLRVHCSPMRAYAETAEGFGISERQVMRIVKLMKDDSESNSH